MIHESKIFDYFGHIRAELPDLETDLPELFRLPVNSRQVKRKGEIKQQEAKPSGKKQAAKALEVYNNAES